MPDVKEEKKTPLQAVLSEPALKEIAKISKELFDTKKPHAKAETNLNAERIVAIIMADLDGKDGQFDGVISKKVILDKITVLQKSGMLAVSDLTKFNKMLESATIDGDPEHVSSKVLIQKVLRQAEGSVDKVFEKLDLNRNGIIFDKGDNDLVIPNSPKPGKAKTGNIRIG